MYRRLYYRQDVRELVQKNIISRSDSASFCLPFDEMIARSLVPIFNKRNAGTERRLHQIPTKWKKKKTKMNRMYVCTYVYLFHSFFSRNHTSVWALSVLLWFGIFSFLWIALCSCLFFLILIKHRHVMLRCF